ncbi:MAG: aldehyde dehydrogenase (NADP(+)) [Trueperaceae bacterium]
MHGHHTIDGERSALGTNTFAALEARTGAELSGRFFEATPDEVAAAAAAAQRAARALRRTPWPDLARFLRDVADELDARGEAIVARADLESGLGTPRLTGELKRTTDQLRLFADEGDGGGWLGVRVDASRGADLRRVALPIGPVAVFGASNFPLAFSVAGGDTAAAWAAGCPVIVKAHPAHPGTSELVADAIVAVLERSPLPAATFQMLHGADHAVGGALVQAPEVRAVAFTGSFAGGTALDRLARERPSPIPVFAEMGSSNPIVVLPGALAARGDQVAAQVAGSITLGAGQFCTKPGVVIGLAGAAFDAFVAEVARTLEGVAPATMLTDGIRTAYRAGVADLAATPAVDVVWRGDGDERPVGPSLLRTTAAAVIERPSLLDEVFGPAALVVVCADAAEARALAEALPGSLTATLHLEDADLDLAAELTEVLVEHVGRLIVNGVPTGVIVSPAQHHGGPYPATLDARATSVGTAAVERFLRPVAFQDVPEALLPEALRGVDSDR